MKTKKSIWSIALVLIMVLALVLSFGLSSQRATVKAEEPVDHITFDITVDGFNEKTIESNYQGLLEVRYTVTENTGVDAMQLRIDFSSAFTLERIEALKTTSLGEPTINNGTAVDPLNGENYVAYENITLEEDNIYIGANIVYEHVNNTYLATGDTLIIAYYSLNDNPTEEVYPFGFWNANNEDGFSTAWKNVANAEQSGTHTPVRINYTDAVVYIMGDYEFTLTGGQKVYDGAPAENSAITVSDNNNQNRPTLNYVWFQGISSDSNTYRKLDSNPVNAGQYFVVLEYEATNRYRAYRGYTETAEPGVYTLDSTEGKVAAYIITLRPVTITIDNQTSAYGDAIVSPLTYQITDGTVVTGDDLDLSITTTATASSNVGTYPITGTRGNYNYDVRFVDGTYTITPKAITIKIDDKSSKYGAPLAELTWGLKTGSTLVGDDQLADLNVVLATTPASLANANVGTYPISGTYSNGKYAVTWENGTYTIESVGKDAEYIFSFIEGLTKNYNGSVQDLLNILAQNANEENKPAWISYTVSNYQQKNAGDYVIPVSVTLSQEVADNYTNGVKEFATTVNGKINKIALTITASAEVQYGDEAPVITIDNGNGWIDSESYATYYESLRDELKDYYVATGYGYGDNAGTEREIVWDNDAEEYAELKLYNYDVILETENFVVAKKVLNAADYAFAGYTDTYDAANHTLAVTGDLDLVNVTISSKATVKDVVDSGVYTATITLNSNYTFENGNNEGWTVDTEGYASASKNAQVTITPKALTINIEYTKTTATFTLSGFAGQETEAVLTNLAYTANQGQSYCINGNVFTVDTEVYDIVTVTATSDNTNYTVIEKHLREIIIVGYLAGPYDANISGETPVLPSNDIFFAGFTTVQPEPVALNHYTFKCFSTDSAGNNPFDYSNVVNNRTAIYVTWTLNNKYTITLYYMVDGDAQNLYDVDELEFYSDVVVRYGHELPSMAAKDWFKVQEWYTDAALTTKYVEGTLSDDLTLYANYKFNIGIGDVNANGSVNANDITLYRQWIVGGYEMEVVEDGEEWATVNDEEYDSQKTYFLKRVADSNAATAESTTLGDEHLDIRDVSTIRMGLVGGYGFSIMQGKYVDGEELIVHRSVEIKTASDLFIVLRSGAEAKLSDDIENDNINEPNFVGALLNFNGDVVIDLNGNTLTLKSLSISLAQNNTGKIEIKNGSIYVADGQGVSLLAPSGSVILDNVTLYDEDGQFTLQAANQSLHFANDVKFLKGEKEDPAPASVTIPSSTHVVVEEEATLVIEKIEVEEVEGHTLSIDILSEEIEELVVDGYVEVISETVEVIKSDYVLVETKEEFIAAAHNAEVKGIRLMADLADLGEVHFVNYIEIDGNGYEISGNSALWLNVLGGKVENLTFKNIHNSLSRLTPVYGKNLAGKLEIKNCEFDTVDWDAIQIEPVAGAEVVIENNTFKHSGENAMNTRRYVHIQSAVNVDFAATVRNNKFYNVNYLHDTAIEVYYPTYENKLTIQNNYVDAPVGVCILKENGANVWYLANSFVEEDLVTEKTMVAAIIEQYNVYFFETLQEAVNFAGTSARIITLIDDVENGDGVIVAENQNITFDFNGHTYIVNGKLVGSKGTETLGFQLLKGSNVTFKNGTLKTVNAKMLIQNYANTTLDNIVVSGEGATRLQYVTSNNFGSLTVQNGSQILAYGNQVATDLWYGMSSVYDAGVTVTLKAGSEVVGKVEYGAQRQIAGWTEKTKLIVENGAVWGKEITLSSDIDYSVTYTVRNARDNGNGHVVDLKDYTLDLNGHIIKSINATVTFGGNGAKIKNGTFDLVEKNTDGSYKDGSYALIIDNAVLSYGKTGTVNIENVVCDGGFNVCCANVTLDNVTAHTTTTKFYAIWAEQDANVIINSGNYADEQTGNSGIFATGKDAEGGAIITVNGGTFTVGNKLVSYGDANSIQIKGGLFTKDPTNYLADEYYALNNNGVYTVYSNVINNLAELKAFRDAVNAGNNFAGKTVTLNADITLDGAWEPISNYSRKDSANQSKWFAGIFDGGNHTISGLTNANLVVGNITEKEEYTYGLFGSVNNAVIKNLTLTNVSISASNGDSLGALVGYYANGTQKAEANISYITISGSVYGSDNVGGVVGRASGSYFKASNITVSGTVEADYKASGLVGTGNANEMVFENCTNNAAVSSTTVRADNAGYNAVAGISITWKDACQKVVLIECVNTGAISTVNANAIYGQLAVDYSPQTDMNENGTWTYESGHWTRA